MTLPASDEKWGPLQSYCYGDHGDQPAAALFFHGNGFSAHTYNTLLTSMSEDISIRAFDLQGHGRSDSLEREQDVRGWQVYRDNIASAVERNGKSILIGHSMGGLSSLFTTMKHPERVRALVLLEPVFLSPHMTQLLGLARLLRLDQREHGLIRQARARRQYFDDADEAAAYFLGRKGLKTWPKDAIQNYASSILRPRRDGEPGLELSLQPDFEAANFASVPGWPWPSTRLEIPVLLVSGLHASSTVSAERADWLRKRAPRLQHKTHETAGHMLPVDAPEWTAEVVRAFLAQLS